MNNPWLRALLISAVGFALITMLIFGILGQPASAAGMGEALGRVGAACLFAGLITAWLGRKASPAWSWWGWIGRWCAALVLLWVLSVFGRGR
ncbi:MAG: hypothetical protein KDI71_09995 [Xanthomonadales bacterium]|nr:hypothetical protein [Xanthomonadales bacterium]